MEQREPRHMPPLRERLSVENTTRTWGAFKICQDWKSDFLNFCLVQGDGNCENVLRQVTDVFLKYVKCGTKAKYYDTQLGLNTLALL